MTDNKLIICVNRNTPGWQMWKKKYYIFWACVCNLSYPSCNVHAPYCHCGLPRSTIFFHIIS